jgi:hypothetical protein
MNRDDITDRIRAHIARQYELLAKRPDVICNPLHAETFISALEGIIDLLDSYSGRADSYQAYLADGQFGMFVFQSKFQIDHAARLGFIEMVSNEGDSMLDQMYTDQFQEHWIKYLEWKRARQSTG